MLSNTNTAHTYHIYSVYLIVEDAANLQFGAIKLDNKDLFGKSDPFFSIYRVNADQTLVHYIPYSLPS